MLSKRPDTWLFLGEFLLFSITSAAIEIKGQDEICDVVLVSWYAMTLVYAFRYLRFLEELLSENYSIPKPAEYTMLPLGTAILKTTF